MEWREVPDLHYISFRALFAARTLLLRDTLSTAHRLSLLTTHPPSLHAYLQSAVCDNEGVKDAMP
jgi:hypothetical protein